MIRNIFLKTIYKNRIFTIATIFAAMLVMGGNLACAKESEEAEYADGQMIIVLDDAGLSEKKSDQLLDDVQDDLSDQLDAEMTSTLIENSDDQGTVGLVEVPESTSVADAVEEAENMDGVAYAQPNYIYHTSDTVNDPYIEKDECYHLSQTKVLEAWDIAKTEGSVQVAVLDTGCRLKHEDLVNNINQDLACDVYQTELNYAQQGISSLPDNPNWVLLKNRYKNSSDKFVGDGAGHGTHVCGLIAAEANNKKGIAGTSYNAKILPVKVFDDVGSNTYTSTLVKGCQYVVYCIDKKGQTDIKVVNMSVAAVGISDPVLESAIATLRNDYGVLTVAAGGNDQSYSSKALAVIPSDYPECLSVVNTDRYNCLASSSMYNQNKDIAAPGVYIYSTINTGNSSYEQMSGTSMSAPIVSGICALLWAHDPDMTVEEVVEAVCSTTTDFGEDVDAGASGVINAKAALEYDPDGKTIDLSQFAEFSINEGESVTYNADGNKPDVYAFGKLLTEGEDYTLTVDSGDTNRAGDVSLTVTGMGKYTGSATLNYKVVMTLSSSTIKVVLSGDDPVYDGTKKQPTSVSVSLKSDSSVKLVEGTDYQITNCSNNINASSKARFSVKGLNNYKGSVTYYFTIQPRAISNASVKEESQTYDGEEKGMELTDLDSTLTEGTDYTIDYGSSDRVNSGQVTATVTGKGNYTGSQSFSFTIKPRAISNASQKYTATVYTGKETSLKLTDLDVDLVEGTDYIADYMETDRINVGTVTVVVTGQGNYTGTASYSYRVAYHIRNVDAVSSVFAYTGKTISMKLKYGSTTLKEGTDYTIVYSNSKDVGAGVAVITGKGHYGGKTSITYKINPRSTKFTQKNSYKKGLRVKWTKLTTQTDGYQLQIATTKNFSNPKTYTLTNTKVNYKTIRNLATKKTYYVRVRTYKVVNNHKYYSSWSEIAAIKTK